MLIGMNLEQYNWKKHNFFLKIRDITESCKNIRDFLKRCPVVEIQFNPTPESNTQLREFVSKSSINRNKIMAYAMENDILTAIEIKSMETLGFNISKKFEFVKSHFVEKYKIKNNLLNKPTLINIKKILRISRDMMRREVIGDEKTNVVRAMIELGFPVDSRIDSVKLTPLIWAAYNGSTSATKMLIENGANLNLYDYQGETALMNAVWQAQNASLYEKKHEIMNASYMEIIDMLIKNGANLKVTNNNGDTVLICAIRFVHQFNYASTYLKRRKEILNEVTRTIVNKLLTTGANQKNYTLDTLIKL
ncbi:hypothetical protein FACS189465_3250 [Clostridia bacterium]|nr:hypothetical protein FACS189465_3250 [Clostridia bacterium]